MEVRRHGEVSICGALAEYGQVTRRRGTAEKWVATAKQSGAWLRRGVAMMCFDGQGYGLVSPRPEQNRSCE